MTSRMNEEIELIFAISSTGMKDRRDFRDQISRSIWFREGSQQSAKRNRRSIINNTKRRTRYTS
jgi:hypothetical protein